MSRTWEQHQRALAKARAAGNKEAVAEIEANIAAQGAETPPTPERKPYSRERYTKAMDKAAGAGAWDALEEIANDWMDAAQADGRKTPRDFSDDEVMSGMKEAAQAGDKYFTTLFTVEANRRGLKEKGILDQIGEGLNAVGGAIAGIPGAVQSGAENFGRGVDRLASGEADMGDLGMAIAENVATGARSIPGADLVYAGGGNIVNMLEGDEVDPTLVQRARQEQQAAAAENPLAALAGEVAGAGAVAGRVLQAPGLAVKAAGAPGNLARTAAAGGIAEGATALVDTLDPGEAAVRAAAGAVVAPVASAVAKKVLDIGAPTARAVRGEAPPEGFKKLSQIVKIPVKDLESAFNALKAQRGSAPSIAEVVDTATLQRAQPVIASQPVVAKAAEAAAEAGETARPGRLKAIVENGKKTGSAKQAKLEQKQFFDDVMKTHGNRPVQFNNPSFMNKDAVVRSVAQLARNADPRINKILTDFLDAVDQGKPATLRVRDIENIRVALSDAIKSNPSLKEALAPVRERLNTIAGNQIPEYGQALKQYGAMGEVVKGLKEGSDAVSGSLADVKSAVGNAGRPRRGGQQVGMRTRLSEAVGDSYGRSTQAAQELVDPALGDRVAQVMGRAEADRIAAAGRREAQAGRNLDELNPAPNPRATRPGNDATLALDAAAALGPAGAGYRANVVVSLINRFKQLGMSEQAAKGLSEGLFDPTRAEEAVAVLKRIGAWEDAKAAIAQRAATVQAGVEGNE